MISGLRSRWHNLLHGLWFLPGLVAAAFAALAFVLVAVDRAAGSSGVDVAFGGSASAARTILSTIAGSIITVAGLAFSITIITLQLVSQQFSPRATRTFLGNRPTQIAAGVFVGVFLYCLIVLRAVREEEAGEFVPGLSVAAAIGLGVLGIGVLLFFINHTAESIKVGGIAARIARETLSAVDDLYPEPYGEPEASQAWEEPGEPVVARAARPGYVQRADLDQLVGDLPPGAERVRIFVHPGEFVTEEQPLAACWPGVEAERFGRAARRAVVVANEREVAGDVGFGIQQLADIALRAVSPSVNDPSTAVTCVGYLTAILERLAARTFPSELRSFPDRGVEARASRPGFDLYVREALVDVGRGATAYPRVVAALLEGAARAAAAAADANAPTRVELLVDTADRIARPALEQAEDADRGELSERLEAVWGAARQESRSPA